MLLCLLSFTLLLRDTRYKHSPFPGCQHLFPPAAFVGHHRFGSAAFSRRIQRRTNAHGYSLAIDCLCGASSSFCPQPLSFLLRDCCVDVCVLDDDDERWRPDSDRVLVGACWAAAGSSAPNGVFFFFSKPLGGLLTNPSNDPCVLRTGAATGAGRCDVFSVHQIP